jgi:uncharacterized alkaline shock family protein YloU
MRYTGEGLFLHCFKGFILAVLNRNGKEGCEMAADFTVTTDLGKITIVEDVISMVAGNAAIECAGIVAMASKRATDGIVELLGRENMRRGVRVQTTEEGAVIDLFIIVEYGVAISAVATTVVETVKYRVETLAGVTVSKINVTVEGIRV